MRKVLGIPATLFDAKLFTFLCAWPTPAKTVKRLHAYFSLEHVLAKRFADFLSRASRDSAFSANLRFSLYM
jgi:hypothetical protein